MACVLDLLAVVRHFVEHNQDIDIRFGSRLGSGEGSEQVDAREALGIAVLEPAAELGEKLLDLGLWHQLLLRETQAGPGGPDIYSKAYSDLVFGARHDFHRETSTRGAL